MYDESLAGCRRRAGLKIYPAAVGIFLGGADGNEVRTNDEWPRYHCLLYGEYRGCIAVPLTNCLLWMYASLQMGLAANPSLAGGAYQCWNRGPGRRRSHSGCLRYVSICSQAKARRWGNVLRHRTNGVSSGRSRRLDGFGSWCPTPQMYPSLDPFREEGIYSRRNRGRVAQLPTRPARATGRDFLRDASRFAGDASVFPSHTFDQFVPFSSGVFRDGSGAVCYAQEVDHDGRDHVDPGGDDVGIGRTRSDDRYGHRCFSFRRTGASMRAADAASNRQRSGRPRWWIRWHYALWVLCALWPNPALQMDSSVGFVPLGNEQRWWNRGMGASPSPHRWPSDELNRWHGASPTSRTPRTRTNPQMRPAADASLTGGGYQCGNRGFGRRLSFSAGCDYVLLSSYSQVKARLMSYDSLQDTNGGRCCRSTWLDGLGSWCPTPQIYPSIDPAREGGGYPSRNRGQAAQLPTRSARAMGRNFAIDHSVIARVMGPACTVVLRWPTMKHNVHQTSCTFGRDGCIAVHLLLLMLHASAAVARGGLPRIVVDYTAWRNLGVDLMPKNWAALCYCDPLSIDSVLHSRTVFMARIVGRRRTPWPRSSACMAGRAEIFIAVLASWPRHPDGACRSVCHGGVDFSKLDPCTTVPNALRLFDRDRCEEGHVHPGQGQDIAHHVYRHGGHHRRRLDNHDRDFRVGGHNYCNLDGTFGRTSGHPALSSPPSSPTPRQDCSPTIDGPATRTDRERVARRKGEDISRRSERARGVFNQDRTDAEIEKCRSGSGGQEDRDDPHEHGITTDDHARGQRFGGGDRDYADAFDGDDLDPRRPPHPPPLPRSLGWRVHAEDGRARAQEWYTSSRRQGDKRDYTKNMVNTLSQRYQGSGVQSSGGPLTTTDIVTCLTCLPCSLCPYYLSNGCTISHSHHGRRHPRGITVHNPSAFNLYSYHPPTRYPLLRVRRYSRWDFYWVYNKNIDVDIVHVVDEGERGSGGGVYRRRDHGHLVRRRGLCHEPGHCGGDDAMVADDAGEIAADRGQADARDEHGKQNIIVKGTRHFLNLRGGGRSTPDTGAGVARWLDEDSSDEAPRQHDRGDSSGQMQAPTPAERNQADDEATVQHAEEPVGMAAWEWLLELPPNVDCETNVSVAPRPISLWHALYGQAEPERPNHTPEVHEPGDARLPPVVCGKQGEATIIVCAACQVDVVTRNGGWGWCRCGTVQCSDCLALPCKWCASGHENSTRTHGLEVEAQTSMVTTAEWLAAHQPPLQPFGRQLGPDGGLLEHWPEEQEGAPLDEHGDGPFQPCVRQAIFHDGARLEDSGLDLTDAAQRDGPRPRCSRCHLDLLSCGVLWRICQCMAPCCLSCQAQPCSSCGREVVGPEQRAHAAAAAVGPSARLAEGDDRDMQAVENAPAPSTGGPRWLTPTALHERRMQLAQDKQVRLTQERETKRRLRLQHERDGRRPRRQRAADRQRDLEIVTINPSAGTTLVDELKHGAALGRPHLVLIQELAANPAGRSSLEKDFLRLGWSPILGDSYYKNRGYGGGTGILSRGEPGVRPLSAPADELEGRFSFGVAECGQEITVASLYGMTGTAAHRQIPLWRKMACALRCAGRPFIVAADWQVPPSDVAALRLDRHLDATIIAPCVATNHVSGSIIDYFLVSNSLLAASGDDGFQVEVINGCRCSPHRPVRLRLAVQREAQWNRRLTQPRLLDVDRPVGPQLDVDRVDWVSWAPDLQASKDEPGIDSINEAVIEWSAGAEQELFSVFGISDQKQIEQFSGIGAPRKEVWVKGCSRYADTPDELGLLGHRLAWAARSLHSAVSHATPILLYGIGMALRFGRAGAWLKHARWKRDVLEGNAPWPTKAEQDDRLGQTPWQYEVLYRVGCRASAFLREKRWPSDRTDEAPFVRALLEALRLLANLSRATRQKDATLDLWCRGDGYRVIAELVEMRRHIDDTYMQLAAKRRRRNLLATGRWARQASTAAAHKATKHTDAITSLSASASKVHRGEATPQRAADKGADEWASPWRAGSSDAAHEVLLAIEAMESVQPQHDEIQLPPIDEERIFNVARTIAARTGVGICGLRPRHLLLVSRACRGALAQILMAIERRMRWPDALREVVEVALGKKTGGARLIGLTSSVYRVWARLRHADCRATLEGRIARPFLSAAPGRGAERAAFDIARQTEVAAAQGDQSAGTLLDIARFYEVIEPSEVAVAAKSFGLPQAIISLCLHAYLGPRRIRVRGAMSRRVFPTRSIIAGCTWATVHVRLLIIAPAEDFLRKARARCEGWGVQVRLNIYVDDAMAITTGNKTGVALVHAWVTKMLIAWVTRTLRKEIAMHKLQVVIPDAAVRAGVKVQLGSLGKHVRANGDLLGTDFTAGAAARTRPMTRSRLSKARKRRHKLRWFRSKGGAAMEVGRGGILPSVIYGGSTHGITAGTLRDTRRIMAAASGVKAAASSTTVRLAIGGSGGVDVDPATTHSNPPLLALSSTWWDNPASRADHVAAWRSAKRDIEGLPDTRAGAAVRGPVGGAMMHLGRVGASWPKPFTVELMDTPIPLLTTPPLVLKRILYAHARRHYDRVLIGRLADENGWIHNQVLPEYSLGIDWGMIRDALNNKASGLNGEEKRALHTLVCGAFWPEERRWKCGGMLPTGTCLACCLDVGTTGHKAAHCGAIEQELRWMKIAGRLIPEPALQPKHRPLLERGLPPMLLDVRPDDDTDFQEGRFIPGSSGTIYGDASGVGTKGKAPRVITWSAVQLGAGHGVLGCDSLPPVAQRTRGVLGGWFPSVPRGELMALIKSLEGSCVPIMYVGDCKAVIDGVANGVHEGLTSSKSPMADLWKRVQWLVRDHGQGVGARKVKAHRSRQRAFDEGGAGGLLDWHGNDSADQFAKQLARSRWRDMEDAERERELHQDFVRQQIHRTAIVFAIAQKHMDDAGIPKVVRPAKRNMRRQPKTECGSHMLHYDTFHRAWACSRCRLIANTAASRRTLAQRQCKGEISDLIPASHRIQFSAGVLWCCRCGAFTTRLPRALRRECPGRPPSASAANVLKRLLRGLPPTTAAYLADHGNCHHLYRDKDENEARLQRAIGGGSTASVQPAARPAAAAGVHVVNAPSPRYRDDGDDRGDGDGGGRGGGTIRSAALQRPAPTPQGQTTLSARAAAALSDETLWQASLRPSGTSQRTGRSNPRNTRAAAAESTGTGAGTAVGLQSDHELACPRDQPSSSAEVASAEDDERGRLKHLQSRLCNPTSCDSWTARLRLMPTMGTSRCHRCGASARATCKGCNRCLCLQCAKLRRGCIDEEVKDVG